MEYSYCCHFFRQVRKNRNLKKYENADKRRDTCTDQKRNAVEGILERKTKDAEQRAQTKRLADDKKTKAAAVDQQDRDRKERTVHEMQQKDDKQEEAFVKKIIQTAMETERQIRRQQVLHNTRILMESYIEMKKHIENAVSEVEQLEKEEYTTFKKDGSAHLESVRRSKMKTALMIANIDRAMEDLRKEYDAKGMDYKYEAFYMHYIKGVPYEDIADIQNCGKNTPSRWSKELIRKMSVKLFGIDGIEKY